MKRKIVFCMCAVMAVSLLAAGCGSKEKGAGASAGAESSSDSADQETDETIYTAEDVLAPLSYDVEDYVVLNDYENMTVSLDGEYTVTDADVEEQLEAMAAMYPNILVDSDKKTVESGDIVNIDYVGYLNGEAFDGGSAEDSDLEIGSGSMVDGFEDALIGAETGKTTTIEVTFPEDYGVDSLNGQTVQFEVTVNAIKEKQQITYGEVSDQWVKDNFYSSMGVTTLDEFREYLKSYLESTNESSQDSDVEDKILEKLLAECEITIPDGYLEERIASYKEAVYALVEESGQNFEERMGVTEEEFETSLPLNMENRVKKDLLLEALVKDMGITFTQSEYNDYVSTYMSTYNYDSAQKLYDAFEGASELSGEDYVKLGYAEHQMWVKLKNSVEVQ